MYLSGTLFVHDASPYEQYSLNIKQAYKQTLQRSNTCTHETVNWVAQQSDSFEFAVMTHTSETERKEERVLRDVQF